MTSERVSMSRVAAAGLLALAAGACLGVALNASSTTTSLHTATATRTAPGLVAPASLSRASVQMAAVQQPSLRYAEGPAPTSSSTSPFGMAMMSGAICGLAAAVVAWAVGGRPKSSEQLAMLAATGKKGAALAKKEARPLWYPTAEAPEWLDGSLPGDRGFDPWGLAKPSEYLQFDLDALDQNALKNPAGQVVGQARGNADEVSRDALAPYSEVFGLKRFRECEIIHGRWAMLAVLGCLVGEYFTGVPWQNAGLVEASNPSYGGLALPFTNGQVVWIEVLLMGAVEAFRNTELDPEKRVYPGGAFDPLGLTNKDATTTFRLKEAEVKHARLAMLAFLGFAVQALKTGLGATQSFGEWAAGTFS